ncbi:meiotic recombination protein SPO11 [Fopius arisanus]|uniref:DNA topoisomerase (ATP-hydrolyzing) n=1 Tax=Fopius arisanus TaxID=64838 RepID=A0A9R1T1W6_9HYME|nr:PREDICTED: meiotic recombination protein SPO11 [Fopius arisanus]
MEKTGPQDHERVINIPVTRGTETRKLLIDRLENLVLVIIRQITSGQLPKIDNLCSDIVPGGVEFGVSDNGEDLSDETATCGKSHSGEIEEDGGINQGRCVVDFSHKRGKLKLALMMTVAAKAHKLLIAGEFQTKRSMFYELKGGLIGRFIDKQSTTDGIINNVARILLCNTWELGFVATAKGLVSGTLELTLQTGEILNCEAPGGVLIPQMSSHIMGIKSRASSIIVVEKDAVFQRLLEEDCTRKMKCILVTGKGYPDAATRAFVKMLIDHLEIPAYILVDADPHGIDIMCVYKYGSSSLSWEQEHLACPTIKWIGIYPSEVSKLRVQRMPLTDADVTKLRGLKRRSYLDEQLREELDFLWLGKAEIEGMAEISLCFLTSLYFPTKI